MNYTKHIFKGGDILYADDLNEITGELEVLSPKISKTSNAEETLSPANNSECRCGTLTSLTLILPTDIPDDYAAWLVFASGSESTAIDYPETIKWSGDDVLDGVFVPVEGQVYNIGLWYDGFNINGVVRGTDL